MVTILAADIGGTHSRFAVFKGSLDDAEAPLLELERERWLKTADFPDFPGALSSLFHDTDQGPALLSPKEQADDIVLAAAGPVIGDSCNLPNADWVVHGSDARRILHTARVFLINDFAAQAYACLTPEALDPVSVFSGDTSPEYLQSQRSKPLAIIGAGTGLGKAVLMTEPPSLTNHPGESRTSLLRCFKNAKVLPSEGGHGDFPFVSKEEFEFAEFAMQKSGSERLIGDTIVSGTGLALLFSFLTGRDVTPHEASSQAAEYPEVMTWYARFYGRACRNYLLDTLATKGLYITGGMAKRIPVLHHPVFVEEFLTSVAQRDLLEKVPLWHVRSGQSGLWGAALYGLLRL